MQNPLPRGTRERLAPGILEQIRDGEQNASATRRATIEARRENALLGSLQSSGQSAGEDRFHDLFRPGGVSEDGRAVLVHERAETVPAVLHENSGARGEAEFWDASERVLEEWDSPRQSESGSFHSVDFDAPLNERPRLGARVYNEESGDIEWTSDFYRSDLAIRGNVEYLYLGVDDDGSAYLGMRDSADDWGLANWEAWDALDEFSRVVVSDDSSDESTVEPRWATRCLPGLWSDRELWRLRRWGSVEGFLGALGG